MLGALMCVSSSKMCGAEYLTVCKKSMYNLTLKRVFLATMDAREHCSGVLIFFARLVS